MTAQASVPLAGCDASSFLQLSLPSAVASVGASTGAVATPAAAAVSPLVMLSVLDHYLRRKTTHQERILGALLGYRTTDAAGASTVHAVNAFPLNYSQTADHKLVLDIPYFERMRNLHLRANPKEVLVGWYATSTDLDDNSVFLQEIFAGETGACAPLVLLVDPASLHADLVSFPVKTFSSAPAGVSGSERTGVLFVEIPISYKTTETDRTGLDIITKATDALDLQTPITSDLDTLELSVHRVAEMLETITAYVDRVIEGSTPPNNTLGRYLLDTVSMIPRIEPAQFSKVFNSHLQDLLMVLYLANLTRTQLAIAERLHKMV